MHADLLELMQKKVAVSAVTPSAMRGRDRAGLLAKIRLFLPEWELDTLANLTEKQFARRLDLTASQLRERAARRGCRWGAARKHSTCSFGTPLTVTCASIVAWQQSNSGSSYHSPEQRQPD